MNHGRIIMDLGGYLSVSRALGVRPNVSWRWAQERGIPARRWPSILELARRQGATHISLEALLAGYSPAQEQRAADAARRPEERAAASVVA
jgi:hypothetical protein